MSASLRPDIRETAQSELPGILRIHERAFGQTEEAELVRAILSDPTAQPTLSLIAEAEDRPLGHILFSRIRLSDAPPDLAAAILAPLAVVPQAQGKGIGGALIETGVAQLAAAGTALVFVLGHPGYYPRFGFAPAGRLGFAAPYPIPEEHAEAWMVRALQPGLSGRIGGTIACCDALMRPELWRE